MRIDLLDLPGVFALIGIASTIGSYWLQNRREEREEKKLTARLDELERQSTSNRKLLRTHDKLLVEASGALHKQDGTTEALTLRADELDQAHLSHAESLDNIISSIENIDKELSDLCELGDRAKLDRLLGRQDAVICELLFVIAGLTDYAARNQGLQEAGIDIFLSKSRDFFTRLRRRSPVVDPAGDDAGADEGTA